MLSDHLAVQDEIALSGQRRASLHPPDIVPVGDEADLHAVGLVRHGDAEALGEGAGLGLLKCAERQDEPRDLPGQKAAEHVALVVARVALVQAAVRRAGVVPRGDPLRVQTVGARQQRAELHGRVAEDAGVRGLAGAVGRVKGGADGLLERCADIQNLQFDAEPLRDGGGVPRADGRDAVFEVEPRDGIALLQ